MNECPVYFINPTDSLGGSNPPPSGPSSCAECCNCGYLQYESLIPYLGEIKYNLKNPDVEKSDELEFRLREQIIEISRLFDIEAGVEAGYFSKAHYKTTRTYPTHGTKYIKVPEFVAGTLEVRTTSNQLIDPNSYGYQDGFLVYLPCTKGTYCSVGCGCSSIKRRKTRPWPNECYQVTARWGKECSDAAVQKAIRDYLINSYRNQDPVANLANGLPITPGFRVPHSWSAYINNFKAKRALYSQFAFA